MRRAIDDTAPPSPLRLGAVRRQLEANGYTVTSARSPDGREVGNHPGMFRVQWPDWYVSEHEAAVLCTGGSRGLVALIVQGVADAQLAPRILDVLNRRKLIGGPCRVGSDGSMLWPLRVAFPPRREILLDGAFTFESSFKDGPFSMIVPAVIPLDGTWRGGDLLSVPYGELAEIDNSAVEKNSAVAALLSEIRALPSRMREEARPKPKPSPFAWIGR